MPHSLESPEKDWPASMCVRDHLDCSLMGRSSLLYVNSYLRSWPWTVCLVTAMHESASKLASSSPSLISTLSSCPELPQGCTVAWKCRPNKASPPLSGFVQSVLSQQQRGTSMHGKDGFIQGCDCWCRDYCSGVFQPESEMRLNSKSSQHGQVRPWNQGVTLMLCMQIY